MLSPLAPVDTAWQSSESPHEDILRDIVKRDEQDRNRPISPLRQAEDAVCLDTSQLDLEQSLQALLSIIKEKIDQ